MSDKTFGIDQDKRKEVPTGLRRSGVTGGSGIKDKYFNQLLFEINQDYIIGTASQLTTGDATLKYLSSDQTLRDKDDNIVALTNGDRIYIIGLDTLTADFDLSAYDRLRVVSDSSISLGNGSQDLIFGDDSMVDLHVADETNVIIGTGGYGFVNGNIKSDQLISTDIYLQSQQNIKMATGKGIDFSANTPTAGMTNQLLDDYEEGTFTPTITGSGITVPAPAVSVGRYQKVGNIVTAYIYFDMSAPMLGTITNPIQINGLPFTSKTTTSIAGGSVGVLYFANYPVTAKQLYLRLDGNQTIIKPYWSVDNGASLQSTGTDFASANIFFGFSITYESS